MYAAPRRALVDNGTYFGQVIGVGTVSVVKNGGVDELIFEAMGK